MYLCAYVSPAPIHYAVYPARSKQAPCFTASLSECNTCLPVSDAMGISELPCRRGNNLNDTHAILCNLGLVSIHCLWASLSVFEYTLCYVCSGLLEKASMLASTVTFVTYIREMPASNLGRDIDYPRPLPPFCSFPPRRCEDSFLRF